MQKGGLGGQEVLGEFRVSSAVKMTGLQLPARGKADEAAQKLAIFYDLQKRVSGGCLLYQSSYFLYRNFNTDSTTSFSGVLRAFSQLKS
jgi:hypothetical protein